MNPPSNIPHDLIRKGRAGRLVADVEFLTPIVGRRTQIQQEVHTEGASWWVDSTLCHDGRLIIRSDTQWNFGSGAVDTPAVVRASLPHDILCHMTNLGLLPWECRAEADRYYRDLLLAYGASRFRAWYQWAVIRLNSTTVACWLRSKP